MFNSQGFIRCHSSQKKRQCQTGQCLCFKYNIN